MVSRNSEVVEGCLGHASRTVLRASLPREEARAISAALLDRQDEILESIEENGTEDIRDADDMIPILSYLDIISAMIRSISHALSDGGDRVVITYVYRSGDEDVFVADLEDIIRDSDLDDDGLELDLDQIGEEDTGEVFLRAAYEARHGSFDRFDRANLF